MTPRLYSMYGLACATNFDWSWCPQASAAQEADLRIELGSLGPFGGTGGSYVVQAQRPESDGLDPPEVRVERGADGHFRITYDDGAAFVIDATASEVFATTRGELKIDDLVVRLQGPILGFVLRLRGVTCLHASAAVVNGRAFALVGAAGAGKSTSAAALARLGLPVLTDDVLALRDGRTSFEAEPGLPRVLLWPESVAALFGNPGALPRVIGGWEKHYLALARPEYQFAQRAAPLGAVYLLGDRLPPGAAPEITSLQGTSALAWLLANTYANSLLDDRLRVRELEFLGRFVTHVPVRLVRVPDDPGAITDACQAVIADFANRN